MTPDGITKKDWDKIKATAARIANAVTADDLALADQETKAIQSELDGLERKYGEKPSILATRAEYLVNPRKSVSILKKAFSIAIKANDVQNKTLIASSLADRYWNDLRDYKNTQLWIIKLKLCLQDHYDKQEFRMYMSLARKIKRYKAVKLQVRSKRSKK